MYTQHKKLYRDEQNKMIGGVCQGLAQYLDIDVSIVRAVFLLALFLKGGSIIIYIILMIVLPKKPFAFYNPEVDYTMPPQGEQVPPFTFESKPAKKSNAPVIAGVMLILLGIILTVDELDLIPYWDFEHLWPVPLIVIGIMLVFTSGKKKDLDPKPPIE
ncbi:PspC domain-containing protein [uncultured Mucilaginibacter sp.]|uniref:PspC domain-containing protein n=1 Tax=uncultured Mucilaginibacter sp. TaxID=797541 RepID=UPI0025FCAC80|nr:PspC domain-containing protein [uncultured Mucilaginibacter sp.]